MDFGLPLIVGLLGVIISVNVVQFGYDYKIGTQVARLETRFDTFEQQFVSADGGQPPADGSDSARIGAWVRDLTFSEVHAFIWGAGLVAGGLLLQRPALLGAAAALLAYAFTRKKALLKDLDIEVPDYLLRQIHREPHYYLGGMATGAVVGKVVPLLATVL